MPLELMLLSRSVKAVVWNTHEMPCRFKFHIFTRDYIHQFKKQKVHRKALDIVKVWFYIFNSFVPPVLYLRASIVSEGHG
jgi:hypothetical protein